MEDRFPKVACMYKEPLYHEGENIQKRVVMMIIPTGDHIEIGDPLTGGDTQIKVEDHQIKEDIPAEMEGPQKRKIP